MCIYIHQSYLRRGLPDLLYRRLAINHAPQLRGRCKNDNKYILHLALYLCPFYRVSKPLDDLPTLLYGLTFDGAPPPDYSYRQLAMRSAVRRHDPRKRGVQAMYHDFASNESHARLTKEEIATSDLMRRILAAHKALLDLVPLERCSPPAPDYIQQDQLETFMRFCAAIQWPAIRRRYWCMDDGLLMRMSRVCASG